VPINLWFENVIDAYLLACARGQDWQEACTTAEQATGPRRVLTQKDLVAKGVGYSRQHLSKKIRGGAFPKPFQPDLGWAPSPAELARRAAGNGKRSKPTTGENNAKI